MDAPKARVLVVDDPQSILSHRMAEVLERHDVDVARDAFDAIYRVDCAVRPYDVIFCDLSRGDLPGPELWAYLSLGRMQAAESMVFVASGPLKPETKDFLARVPNVCVDLSADWDLLSELVTRRAPGVPGLFEIAPRV